ncbi:MAG: NAD-glutamate dehydrogenase [Sphingomonadaceae bacterium]
MATAGDTATNESVKFEPDVKVIDRLAEALVAGALPGETADFAREDRYAAAELALEAIEARAPGQPGIASETALDQRGRRQMRIAVANDDMPFLVDSIAATIAAHGLDVDRILHPILDHGGARLSLVYVETERADAAGRRALIADLATNLGHVRAAVTDWKAMQAVVAAHARQLGPGEGAALLDWFLDRNFTQLASARFDSDNRPTALLGLAGDIGDALLAPESRMAATRWLKSNAAPLLLKSSFMSTVHRRAPLDLVIVPSDDDGIAIHAGLWTSAALATPPQDTPLLRTRLAALQATFGFAPDGHAGKSLTHALTSLPHDLLLVIDEETLGRLALTAMSLADRPRPALVLARDALDRHVFAFVWLPRDDLTTARRIAIADMLAQACDSPLLSWSIDLGDGGVALLRYTFDRRQAKSNPDAEALQAAIVSMVRGWQPSVEASLAALGDAGRAARLAIRYAEAFPLPYRNGAGPDEAALDILRLQALPDDAARGARLYRNPDDAANRLRLKIYSLVPVTLSSMVPALENFGFAVVEEMSTLLARDLGHIHRFVLDLPRDEANAVIARADVVEATLSSVLDGTSENDGFNALLIAADLAPASVVLFRALFRYLRQTGLSFGLSTVVSALAKEATISRALVALFDALHDPAVKDRVTGADAAHAAIETGLAAVTAIDEDRILRLLRSVIGAIVRTNAFSPSASEAIAFKFDSAKVPGLPAPVPWREVWVYSRRVEGIHLRAGPVARGGLRWSDRRDDFRTEILGLMKAQRVKNAVIVPTGAKGGFYPKALPNPAVDRDAWLAEGTESYRIFIRTLLSVTDNLVEGKVVHPAKVAIHDGDDPYFVVAADKGTATFSDIANAIALERDFWLGDAFASGGSVGYDHKAMGITAKGAWVSVQRHFAEAGIDVQTDPIRVVGCGDMSGDVFGNGMLLSKTLKIVAAFDHRHIFIDPDPDSAASWAERARLFALPRSSWDDYDKALISSGGGVFARSAKTIALSPEARAALDITAETVEPSALITAILKSPADLIWFGGIGTYVKASTQSHADVGDPANDAHRVNAEELRAKVIGEGANLGVTQAARIAFAARGGRINTDFIDNSAGVDCSDNEVNIKIALNAEVTAAALDMTARNALLASMTDAVAALVLEDNRLQTLALSIAQRGGSHVLPSMIRLIETFETTGRLDRVVEGLAANDVLLRRMQDGQGFTRPELAVLMSTAKIALQDAIEQHDLARDRSLLPDLMAAFPVAMHSAHADAIARHPLRGEIIATKVANRLINRMGLIHPFELAEEEGASLGDIATAFVIAERLFGLDALWEAIDSAKLDEAARLMLFEQVALEVRAQMADLLRTAVAGRDIGATVAAIAPGLARLTAALGELVEGEARMQASGFAARLIEARVPQAIVDKLVLLVELDGGVGLAALGNRSGTDEITLARAFTHLGSALGLDWAQGMAMRLEPIDPWERLLIAGLARDFQQMRLEFLAREPNAPEARVDDWLLAQAPCVAQFRALIDRARIVATPSPAMLAQIAGQARVLLGRD